MLQTIKDRASGWIAYIIVALIAVVFALGINSYVGGGGGDPQVVAEVNGDEIPLQTFNAQFQQQKRRLAELNDGALPSSLDDGALKASVIQGLVLNRLIAQEVENAGYQVGDRVLFERIEELQVFRTDGQFSAERYSQLLAAQGLTERGFEQSLREEIRQSQFVEGVQQTAFITPELRRDYARLAHQQRDLSWFVIPADLEGARAEIGDEAVTEYYEAQKSFFKTPERVKLAYVVLDRQALMEQVEVNEKTLRAHYRSQLDRYSEPEQRRARHILIEIPAGADEKAVANARAQAEKLSARLAEGMDFATLAERYSDDTLSASSGGDLGFILRGDMGERFEDVLFSLEKGAISDPVKTDLGFQILELEEIRPAQQRPFKAVRGEVEKDYRQRSAEGRLAGQTETLLTVSYEQPDSLEPTADALGVDVQTTGWLTPQAGEGIADDLAVRGAAFSDEVLERGRNSDLIELSDNRMVVVRVIEHEPAKPQPLKAVREDIIMILAVQRARERAREAGEAALATLREGHSFQKTAGEYGAEVESPGFVERDSRQAPGRILNTAFSAGKPGEKGAVYGGVRLPDGGYAVLAVRALRSGVNPGKSDSAVAETRQAIDYGARELQAVFDALKAQAEVKIMRDNL